MLRALRRIAANGTLVAYFRVPAFVATLSVMYVARGIALLITNGLTFNNLGGKPLNTNITLSESSEYKHDFIRVVRIQT